ncbi:unnamed protein product [Schistosoma spindalis]|nr:unnamed protein product [Schistosoma spindale]
MADIAFDHITQEVRGTVYPGKLRLKEDEFMYKNEKTGKVDHFYRSDIESAQWIVRATGLGLSIKLKNNSLHRYDGFGEIEAEKVGSFFKKYFDIEIVKRELCYKGYNWGDVDFDGDVLEFSVKNAMAFEVPLSNVANAVLNKNEIIFEFHLNDEAEVCLSEMRLYTPGTEADREGKAPSIYSKVTQKADIIQVTGDFLVEFKQLQCLQPRGRYDVKLYPSFIHLHGKSYDFKVPKNTITRLMVLPHPDNRQIFFAVQLDPPIKHGQTRYHFVISLFDKDSHINLEMAATEDWLQEQFNGKLNRNISGPEYEVVARVFKVLFDQKVTVPGSFSAKGGGCAVACSYKASVGLLYPLERGFTFVPRPPISIRFDEIIAVQFSRGTGAQRSFDFEVETRNGLTHTFTSIERDEYHHLYDFVTAKKLRVKNISSENKTTNPGDDVWSSSDESHDAYMEKVKTEARERTTEMDDDDDDDEDDEDFKPPESDGSELAEEYDSNVQTTTSEDESGDNDDDDDGDDSEENKSNTSSKNTSTHKKKDKRDNDSDGDKDSLSSVSSTSEPKAKQKKLKEEPKKATTKSRKDETKRQTTKKQKKPKDPNAPTRPLSAYFLWFNENREKIAKNLNGQNSVAEVAKAAGEIWRNMDSTVKSSYQSRVDELKKKYQEDLRIYQSNLASSKEPDLSPDSSS